MFLSDKLALTNVQDICSSLIYIHTRLKVKKWQKLSIIPINIFLLVTIDFKTFQLT